MEDLLAGLPGPSERRMAVRVNDEARREIRRGHPWVFESSITSVSSGDGRPGDLAVVFDGDRRFQGIGLYDPASPIRVRMLHHGRPVPITPAWWRQRFAVALERRGGLLASTSTTGFRCVHGENDGLPGLVVDRYAGAVVVKLYSAAWVPHLRTVATALASLLSPEVLVVRLSRAVQREGVAVADGTVVLGQPPAGPILFRENDLVLEADVVAGQKTGHFLDQRDNRRLAGSAAAGARVLDVFACTGGFSLSAAAGGARSVRSVDISRRALEAAGRSFGHNRHRPAVRACRHQTTAGDAFEVMAALRTGGERFDVVVVDPPSFAHAQAGIGGALRSYRRLTELAVGLLDEGGLLVQASCSSRVPADDFFATVDGAAASAGCRLDEVRRTGHPVDHPIGFEHGAYLKALFARVRRR